jgi:hypothetical protein
MQFGDNDAELLGNDSPVQANSLNVNAIAQSIDDPTHAPVWNSLSKLATNLCGRLAQRPTMCASHVPSAVLSVT